MSFLQYLPMQRDLSILEMYMATRAQSLELCKYLENEDFGLQGMPEVSPPKWHLAHTTWFFETFILKTHDKDYQPFNPRFEQLFNSYYNGIGEQYPRPHRGMLSRPTVKEVMDYRQHVDHGMKNLLLSEHNDSNSIENLCTLGINHEQQHQELFCTDIKYSFSLNPLYPALKHISRTEKPADIPQLSFIEFSEADTTIGFQENGFHFDNEEPAHKHHFPGFKLANRLITNAEYREFINDGGYQQPMLWLADGWSWVNTSGKGHPLYWVRQDSEWFEYTLYGLTKLNPCLPVCHINYYEADAFARWQNSRLSTEHEWEYACRISNIAPSASDICFHPQITTGTSFLNDMFGQTWQWTQSGYLPYPGYQSQTGAIGEYNGKFMCNQMVLRGSSCVTPPGHARNSYRNFFYPKDQWQFSGIRLASNL